MKIKINENETYEIKLNDEVSLQDLKNLINRIEILSDGVISATSTPAIPTKLKRKYVFSNDNDNLKNVKCINCSSQRFLKKGLSKKGLRRLVCKNCKVSFTINEEGNVITPPKKRKHMKWEGKTDVIDALKIHYFGTKAQKMQFAENKNASWETITKAIHELRRRFNINPQEIGLQEFPVHKVGRPTKAEEVKEEEVEQVEQVEPEQIAEPFKIPTPTPPLELRQPSNEQSENEEKPKWWNRKEK